MEVSLYNQRLSFSDNYISSAGLFYYVNDVAKECSERMINAYRCFNSLNELIAHGQSAKDKIYFESIEEIVEIINDELGIYSVNFDSFKRECQKYWGNFEIVFAEIYEKYLELSGERELAKKYREYRKNSRARLVGGGFGISGAAKGMMMAGAANMTTGVVHSVFNLFDSAFTNAGINNQMKKVFHDPSNKNALAKAVYNDILNIIHPIVNIIQSNSNFRMEYDFQNYERANIIFTNIENNKIPKENLKENIAEMIYLSPFEPRNYAIAYHLLGDESDELERLSDELNVDIDLAGYKQAERNARYFFGKDYEKVESKMGQNIFYRKTKGFLGSDYSTLLFECKQMLNDRLKDIVISIKENDEIKRFNNAISLFGNFNGYEECPLILFDKSITASGKDGFIITDKSLYFNGGSILPLSEITNVGYDPFNFIINNHKISITWANLSQYDLAEFKSFFEYFLLVYKYSGNIERTNDNEALDNQKGEMEITLNNEKDASEYARKVVNTFSDSELDRRVYPISNDPNIIKKFQGAMSSYASLDEDEIPLICFDNTAFGSAKDGCLITSKGIYIHNTMAKPKKFLLGDISVLEIKGAFSKEVFINGYELQTTLIRANDSKIRFCDMLNKIKDDLGLKNDTKVLLNSSDNINEDTLVEYANRVLNSNISNSDMERHVFAFSNDPKVIKKFQNAISSYASLDEDEIPLICFDNTAFGSAKDGCLITSAGIHIHNQFSKPKKMFFDEITSIELRGSFSKELFVNNYEIQTTLLSTSESKTLFCKLLNRIAYDMKK